jgi:hypothetical protein
MNDRLKNTLLVLVLIGGLLIIALLISPGDAIGLYMALFAVLATALFLRGVWRMLRRVK